MVQWQKGPECSFENCRSERYFEEDGMLYCKNGHQREDFVSTQPAEEDFGTQGQRSTKKREVQEKGSRVFSGAKANDLFLKAYMLILRKQCWTLIHTHHLPAEIQTVVKDLWEFRISLLTDRLKLADDSDEAFSSQPQSDTEDEGIKHGLRRKWELQAKRMPTLLETLSLCYLAVAILRLPIGLGDFHRHVYLIGPTKACVTDTRNPCSWATREEIPYIRAIREVPQAMKDRLPPHRIAALDTQSILKVDDLRKSVTHLIILYDHSFGLVLRPLNYPLFLFRHIRDLALPLDVHKSVIRMSQLLSITYSFPKLSRRQITSDFPEVQLMALVVIAVKLYHPFDGMDRCVTAITDHGVMTIDWETWCKHQKAYEDRLTSGGKFGRGNEIKVTEPEVLSMTGDQMDEYMDWYERTWVNDGGREHKKGGLPTQLLDMFPTGRMDGTSAPSVDLEKVKNADQEALDIKLKAVQASLKVRDVVSKAQEGKSKEPIHRLGSFYKRYKKEEDLPAHAKAFYAAAANLIAISLPTLIIAVLQTEQKLFTDRKKQVQQGNVSDSADEDGDEATRSSSRTAEDDVDSNKSVENVDGFSTRDIERMESLDIDRSDSETSEMQID